MKLNILLFLSGLTVLTSCNGQNTSQVANGTVNDKHLTIAFGDTVKELGKNRHFISQKKE